MPIMSIENAKSPSNTLALQTNDSPNYFLFHL